jgi:FtsH-binding integral membrane protein
VLESGYTRSDERHWAFELQYHQFLFNYGAVGVVLIVIAAVLVLALARQAAAASPENLPVLVVVGTAALALLIANATNPYLQATGHHWGIALAVGVAHALALGRDPDEPGLAPMRAQLRAELRA